MAKIHAPYNFIGYEKRPFRRYDSVSSLPKHNVLEENLHSGEIHYSLEAVTPVFVSNGDRKNPGFFTNHNGEYEIPGSSIRGIIRENVQILGCGMLKVNEDVENYSLMYRKFAGTNSDIRDRYNKILGTVKKGKSATPKKVRSGFIYKEGNRYYINETEYYKISRSNPELKKMYNGMVPPADFKEVLFTVSNNKVDHILPKTLKSNKDISQMKEGVFLSTGRPVGNKNPLYVISKRNDEKKISVSEADIKNYEKDYLFREKSLKQNRKDKRTDFWKLPTENNKYEPIFFAEENGHIYLGKCLFIRIAYPHSIADGIKIGADLTDEPFLDYPNAMFGFAGATESYHSRICFDNLKCSGSIKEMNQVGLTLSEPRPSYFPSYLTGKDDSKVYSYLDEEFMIRGYKKYWLSDVIRSSSTDNEKIVTNIKPLPIGTKFKGVVRYNNLTDDELGLLLWSMELDGGYIGVGQGKPYGYGCMKPSIEEVMEIAPEKLYKSGFSVNKKNNSVNAKTYIEKYKEFNKACVFIDNKKYRRNIEDFLFMSRLISKGLVNTKYMSVDEYKTDNTPLDSVKTIIKAQKG